MLWITFGFRPDEDVIISAIITIRSTLAITDFCPGTISTDIADIRIHCFRITVGTTVQAVSMSSSISKIGITTIATIATLDHNERTTSTLEIAVGTAINPN